MNIERTRKYYSELNNKDLRQCNYCLNYYEEADKEYPWSRVIIMTTANSNDEHWVSSPLIEKQNMD